MVAPPKRRRLTRTQASTALLAVDCGAPPVAVAAWFNVPVATIRQLLRNRLRRIAGIHANHADLSS
jgi:hypothetical protein